MTLHRYNMHPGQWEEPHTVAPGESLSKIASHYHSQGWVDLADWHPIFWLTRERTGLWRNKHKPAQLDNEDLIYPGDLLVIPRSRSGYSLVIHRLHELLLETRSSPRYAAQVKKEAEHFSEGLNLASDALTFIASLGASALIEAGAAKIAVRAAAKEALKKKTLSAVEMGLKITEFGAKSTGHEDAARYAGTAAKVVHVADLAHGAKEFGTTTKDLYKKKEYWRLAGESVAQVVDVLDVAVEWTQPSKLSKGLIHLFTGTDVDATIDHAVEYENRSRERMCDLLERKIAALHAEMRRVYVGE